METLPTLIKPLQVKINQKKNLKKKQLLEKVLLELAAKVLSLDKDRKEMKNNKSLSDQGQ